MNSIFSNMLVYRKDFKGITQEINYRRARLEREGYQEISDGINWEHYKLVVNAKLECMKHTNLN